MLLYCIQLLFSIDLNRHLSYVHLYKLFNFFKGTYFYCLVYIACPMFCVMYKF